ncbi:hypothetical protein J5J86_20790 [Aquabacter sp. L1I39]|uniref:hypothetical protein n=1 Tax=Aquabacter sp. L1I39 TaxID=2820278 RepID=UPI001ADA901B|nr:hypothetical protein [Aquabacter sp. L1I39]QTL03163.1 hypothetical protein J5J86_20790 [Aquabacter sp. L1I39]
MSEHALGANAPSLTSRRSFLGTAVAAGAALAAVPAVASTSAPMSAVEAEIIGLKARFAATIKREMELRAIHNEADRRFAAALRMAGEDKACRAEVEARLRADCDAKERAWAAVLTEQDAIVGAACEIQATTLNEILAKAALLPVVRDDDTTHQDLALSIMRDLREMGQ